MAGLARLGDPLLLPPPRRQIRFQRAKSINAITYLAKVNIQINQVLYVYKHCIWTPQLLADRFVQREEYVYRVAVGRGQLLNKTRHLFVYRFSVW